MTSKDIKEIWIAAEQWVDGYSKDNENSDVIVTFEDDSRWVATFFTFQNATDLMNKWYENEIEKHFWASDMILVPKFDREHVESVIRKMIEEDIFTRAFNKCLDDEID